MDVGMFLYHPYASSYVGEDGANKNEKFTNKGYQKTTIENILKSLFKNRVL